MASSGPSGLLQNLAGAKKPSLLDLTMAEYPGIAEALGGAAFRMSPRTPGDPRGLEFYPPGEEESFDRTKPAIEVFDPAAQPKDLAGDMVSHWLAKGGDPVATQAYRSFEGSLTPEQVHRLHEQYQWAVKNEGEERPYDEWYRMSGLPAYFRGYLFRQWPGSEKDDTYTPAQLKQFDEFNRYLKTPRKK